MQQANWGPDLSSFIEVLVEGLLLRREGDGFGLRQVALHCSLLDSLQVGVQLAHGLHTQLKVSWCEEVVSCQPFSLYLEHVPTAACTQDLLFLGKVV